MIERVSHRAEYRNRAAPAVVGRGGRVEAPGGALIDGLVGVAARDHRRGRIHYRHLLAAPAEIATKVGRLPHPRCVKRGPAMIDRVRRGADYGNYVAPAVVGRGGRVKAPSGA